jgi:hypothetical protein
MRATDKVTLCPPCLPLGALWYHFFYAPEAEMANKKPAETASAGLG